MRLGHALPDLLDEREHNERGDSVADESSDDEDQSREDEQDAIETEVFDALCDGSSDGVEEAGRVDCFAERETARGQDDDCPEEVVEVFFCQDAGAEEEDDGDDGDDAHVAEHGLELVAHAPEDDGCDGDDRDEPLNAGEFVFHGANRHDGRVASRPEGYE